MPMFIQRKPTATSSKTTIVTVKRDGSTPPNGLRALGKQPVRPKPAVKNESEPEAPKMDEPGTYTDYKIMSGDLQGLKFNAFRFHTDKKVSPRDMARPVKLNRKDPIKKVDEPAFIGKLEPMMGADGKPVIGPDGSIVMVDATGKPALQHSRSKGSPAFPDKGKRKLFQKKTRQVFTIPEEKRQLKKEERFPWVMEDSRGETWVGQLEDLSRAETQAFLMTTPATANNGDHFIFIPSHRWYKMSKRLNLNSQNLEEAEEKMAKFAKNKGMFWAGHVKPKTEDGAAGPSLAPGGRRLKAVDRGERTKFEEDDEFAGSSKKRKIDRELGEEGDMEEVEFEEDFADDDAGGELDAVDEDEAKELEERIKREWIAMNKSGKDSEDESDLEELTGAGKDLQKMLKGKGKQNKDSNPYADSDESEEEEEEPQKPPEIKAGIDPSFTTRPSRVATPTPAPAPAPAQVVHRPPGQPPLTSPTASRANSPGLGNAVVAKRATSPKPPTGKLPGRVGSRAGSPLAGDSGSRAGSPVGSRATSPGIPSAASGVKRKSEDMEPVSPGSPTSPGAPKMKMKKRNLGPLTEEMIIEWLKTAPNPTTKTCIEKFRKYISTGATSRDDFTAMIKRLAKVVGGELKLRPQFTDEKSP